MFQVICKPNNVKPVDYNVDSDMKPVKSILEIDDSMDDSKIEEPIVQKPKGDQSS
jgi:hypothetical protein